VAQFRDERLGLVDHDADIASGMWEKHTVELGCAAMVVCAEQVVSNTR
jgi:hypothetical protein